MAAAQARLICASADLQNGGRAWRFEIEQADGAPPLSAFAVRYRGQVYAYVNACRHIRWNWTCATAKYSTSAATTWCAACTAPAKAHTGYCVSGPCRGQRLIPVPVSEQDDGIYINVRHPDLC